jgi:hypothetical protein
MVDTIIDFVIIYFENITNIFVENITQCYGNVLIKGEDNLKSNVVTFLMKGFQTLLCLAF